MQVSKKHRVQVPTKLLICMLVALLILFSLAVYALAKNDNSQDFLSQQDLDAQEQSSTSGNTSMLDGSQTLQNLSEGKNLNELYAIWIADSSHGSDFIIDEGGDYYLDSDLTSAYRIIIKTPGENVKLDLGEHSLTIDTQTIGYGIDIQQAAQVSIEGAQSSSVAADSNEQSSSAATDSGAAAGSKICFTGFPMLAAINFSADKLIVKDVEIQAKSRQTRLANLESSCITLNSGTLEATRVKAIVDQTNQSVISDTSGASFYGAPAAFNIKSQCLGASFEDCTATTTGSPAVALDSSPDSEIGHAYALRSETSAAISVNNGSYSAQIPHGASSAIRAKNLSVSGNVSLKSNAAKRAYALESFSETGIQVDAQLELGFTGNTTPEIKAGFYSSVQNGFLFKNNASFSSTGALVCEEDGKENLPSARIASVSGIEASKIAAQLSNALEQNATCDIAFDASGIYFSFDETKAVAQVQNSGGQNTFYATLSQAIDAMQDGDTLILLQDAKDIVFNKDAGTDATFTIDMNGKSASSLSDASISKLSLISSNGRAYIEADPKTSPTISLSAQGSLSISGIDVINRQANISACAIEATAAAKLELNNVSVEASAQSGYARGVRLSSSNGSLSAKNSQIKATTACAGVNVRGIMCAAKTTCDISDTDIDVSGITSTITGIESSGVVRFCGSDSSDGSSGGSSGGSKNTASINVSAAETPTSAACINLLNASAKAIIKDVNVSLSCSGENAQSSCIAFMAGTKTNYMAATWVFDGAVNIDADGACQITHKSTPLCLGSSLTLSNTTVVSSMQLDGNVFAKAASEKDLSLDSTGQELPSSSILDDLVSSFSAAGDYEGWKVQAQDVDGVSCLAWTHDAVAQVTHDGTTTQYSTLPEAVLAAQENDTVELIADVRLAEALTIDKQITLDLVGHKLSFELSSKTGQTDALLYNASGVFAIKDSAATQGIQSSSAQSSGVTQDKDSATQDSQSSSSAGSLEINLGSPLESEKLSYSAITVSGGGTLVLDAVSTTVSYTGTTMMANLPVPTLRGVSITDGSFSMKNVATLQVNAALAYNAYGANTAIGIYVSSSDERSCIDIEDTCNIKVDNTSKMVSLDSLQVPDPDDTDSTAQPAYVVQIFPDKNSKFYQEICEKFVEQAQFDDSTESGNYNSQIYYSTPLMLDDGTRVWAYSDPVDVASKGHLASIMPTRFFVICGKDTPTCAYGIQSASSFTGKVCIDGKVSINCSFGDAYAIDAQGSSTWTAQSESLSEHHGDQTYYKQGKRLDMRDYFDLGSKYDSAVLIPQNGAPQVSLITSCKGVLVNVDDNAQVEVGGTKQDPEDTEDVQVKDNGIEDLDDAKRAQLWAIKEISISFDNVRAQDGSVSQVTAEQKGLYGSTLLQAGVDVPQPADYTDEDGAVLRFIGWSISGSSSGYTYTADTFAGKVKLNSEITGAKNGSITFTARYVLVKAGEHLVSFITDTTISAYSLSSGKQPSYAQVAADTRAAVPAKVDSADGCYYSFAGWSDEQNADEQDSGAQDAGEQKSTYWTLPAATQDATYFATFELQESLVLLTFTYRNSDGAWVSGSQRVKYYTDTNEISAKYVQKGDVIKTSETVYTCTGFGPRKTDVEPYYTQSLPSMKTDSFWRYSNVYYAKYDTAARTVNVTFMDGDEEYAKTSSPVETSVLFDSVLTSLGKENPSKDSNGRSFLGWSKTKGATSPDITVVNSAKLSTLVDGDSDDLVLYAVYGDAQPAVIEFYDSAAYPNNLTSDNLITTLSVERGSSIAATLLAAKKSAITPTCAGKYFAGWIDASGNAFSTSDAVKANTKLFATYKDVDVVQKNQAKTDFSIDTSKLLISVADINEADNVTLSLEPVTSADLTLSSLKVGKLSYSAMLGSSNVNSIYRLRLFYTKNNSEYEIEKNFGTIAITANIPNASQASKTRVFWVGSDGMAYTKVSQNAAQISFEVHYLGYVEDGYGNVVIGIAANSAKQGQLDSDTISPDSQDDSGDSDEDSADTEEKSDVNPLQVGTTSSPSVASLSGAASNALSGALGNTNSKSGQAGKNGLSNALSGNQNAGAGSSSDITSQVDEGQNGNVLGLVIIAALFAALLARLGFYLFKRRRKDDTEISGAQMPIKETVHF